jgi:hypothetical protein
MKWCWLSWPRPGLWGFNVYLAAVLCGVYALFPGASIGPLRRAICSSFMREHTSRLPVIFQNITVRHGRYRFRVATPEALDRRGPKRWPL